MAMLAASGAVPTAQPAQSPGAAAAIPAPQLQARGSAEAETAAAHRPGRGPNMPVELVMFIANMIVAESTLHPGACVGAAGYQTIRQTAWRTYVADCAQRGEWTTPLPFCLCMLDCTHYFAAWVHDYILKSSRRQQRTTQKLQLAAGRGCRPHIPCFAWTTVQE